ncbi:MAG: 50S ribosomal protein L24e [Candidatus Aenigmatarchaeota archaeon]|nr:50S ribosomal protein L24e [Nanoarchaeota archaeon]
MKCTFCGKKLLEGRGKMFVGLDSKVSYFCGSKCQKNARLGRVGKNFKWTEKFEKG